MRNKTLLTILTIFFIISPVSADEQLKNDENSVQKYMREFVNSEIKNYPHIFEAIKYTLEKLPPDVYEEVTRRNRPIVFLNTISSGIARFARSNEFMVEPNDPPTFTDGFYLITLADELNAKGNPQAISGIVAHEIAHRYLEHLHQQGDVCDMEREANRAIKEWGFEEEFKAASDLFGAKKKGDSPCRDKEL